MSRIISSKEAAETLGTSERRVQQLAAELDLPRLGRQFVFTEKDVKKMAARKTRRGPAKSDLKQFAATERKAGGPRKESTK